jgi:hypothetical protein
MACFLTARCQACRRETRERRNMLPPEEPQRMSMLSASSIKIRPLRFALRLPQPRAWR